MKFSLIYYIKPRLGFFLKKNIKPRFCFSRVCIIVMKLSVFQRINIISALFSILLLISHLPSSSAKSSEVITYVDEQVSINECKGKCGMERNNELISIQDNKQGPNRVSTHIYALLGLGITTIGTISSFTGLFTTVNVSIKDSAIPSFTFRQSAGFGTEAQKGCFTMLI